MRGKLIYLFLLVGLTANSQDSILYDCVGNDVTEVMDWVGDGFCDDGSYSWDGNDIYFNCEEFNFDEGDCTPQEQIPGCVDVNALNYVPEATLDDGSCIYPFFENFVW